MPIIRRVADEMNEVMPWYDGARRGDRIGTPLVVAASEWSILTSGGV